MRVGLEISAALGQGAGIGRYAREIARALHSLGGDLELLLFHNRHPVDRLPPALKSLPRIEVPLSDKVWRLMLLLGGSRMLPQTRQLERRCDLFHATDVIAPAATLPKVVTVHDCTTLMFPEYHEPLNRAYQRLMLPRMTRRAQAVIAVSHATRRDLQRLLDVPDEKIHVVYSGVDHAVFHPQRREEAQARVARELGVQAPYVLALGTVEPRKNLRTLLEAHARLGDAAPKLVLAGRHGWGRSTPADRTSSGRVVWTGYVPDPLLPALYAGAEVFAFPSMYEGFGFPVLEGMACGAPVVGSATSSLPEVAGDAAILVSPSDSAELARALEGVLADSGLRRSLSERGIERAARFTWRRAAEETLEVYRRVAASP